MKSAIELFSALGRRLADFGGDAPTQEVAERACRANGWFTPADVRRAVAAIADGMLRRDRLETWLAPYPVPVAVPRRVLVVMAGNIPLVGFFDLLCVLAAGHRCLVKPSAKTHNKSKKPTSGIFPAMTTSTRRGTATGTG